jgi:hypothetical protein
LRRNHSHYLMLACMEATTWKDHIIVCMHLPYVFV